MPNESVSKMLKVVVDNSTDSLASKYQNIGGIDLSSSEFYENREISHFKFNLRVLTQAKNKKPRSAK